MSDLRITSRYVKSLLDLAVEQGHLEAVHQDMLLFSKVCRESRNFSLLLKSPVIRHEKKRAILEKIFGGRMNKLTLAIIDIVTRKNREPFLAAIAHEFHNAYNIQKGIGIASITTTVPMDKSLRAEIEAIVKKLSNKKTVEIEEKVDANLIGGFILNVGDRQVDGSIRSKLAALKLKFTENPYQKQF